MCRPERVLAGRIAGNDGGFAEQWPEFPPEGQIDLRHRGRNSEIGQTGHAKARLVDAARNDPGVVAQVAIDVERDAVQGHPPLHADADCGDLVLMAGALVRPRHPDADTIFVPRAQYVEGGEGVDDPGFERRDEAADVRSAAS